MNTTRLKVHRAGTSGANASAGSVGSAGGTSTTERQAATHIGVLVWNRFNNFD